MTHYHILSGPASQIPVADVQYDDYEEAIVVFVELANSMFGKIPGTSGPNLDLSLDTALEATEYGESRGAYCGNQFLTLYWLRCTDTVHKVPAWN